jgi:hypothetical protein
LYDSTFAAAQRKWLAAHLPIRCVRLVQTTDDPWMVVRHVSVDGSSNNVEPCYHTAALGRLGWRTLYDGCGEGCVMCEIVALDIAGDGVMSASLAWQAVITLHW